MNSPGAASSFSSVASPAAVTAPAGPAVARVAALLESPLLPLLARQAAPTIAVMFLVTLLSVAETWFVAGLGTESIAAASLVVPVQLLMTMVSNGGIGGGVSAAIARAMGAGRQDEAERLAWHAVAIAVGFGAAFTLALWLAGPALYRLLGGRGEVLRQALLYSNIVFGGAILSWVLMLLQAALRGAGNPALPARVMGLSVGVGLLLSPALIRGWAGLPRLGIAGAGVAQIVTNALAVAVVLGAMRRPGAALVLRPSGITLARTAAILRVGLPSALNATMANVALTSLTAAAGVFGTSVLAGFGVGSRLDTLLVPVLFGFGTAAITVVAFNLGAGRVARARRAALLNALVVAAAIEALGLWVAWQPGAWLNWFSADAAVLLAGQAYLHAAAPAYGGMALAMELYFAGQGAGRIGWPLAATALRLGCALAAALLAARGVLDAHGVFTLAAAGTWSAGLLALLGFHRTPWAGGAAAGAAGTNPKRR